LLTIFTGNPSGENLALVQGFAGALYQFALNVSEDPGGHWFEIRHVLWGEVFAVAFGSAVGKLEEPGQPEN